LTSLQMLTLVTFCCSMSSLQVLFSDINAYEVWQEWT
jgi:hypothetical protein